MSRPRITRARGILRAWSELPARLDAIEADLDSDEQGSIAQALGDLVDEHRDLRARVDEWCGVEPAHTERGRGR